MGTGFLSLLPTRALEPQPSPRQLSLAAVPGQQTPGARPRLWHLQHSFASSWALPFRVPQLPWHPPVPTTRDSIAVFCFFQFLRYSFYFHYKNCTTLMQIISLKDPILCCRWLVINVHWVTVSRQFIISRRCALSGKWILSYGYSRFTT